MRGGRYGLFIGISKYKHFGGLPGALNDADLLGDAFAKTYGFQPRFVTSDGAGGESGLVPKEVLHPALVRFRREISKASVALIYVAAHGLSVGRKNFIIASNSPPPDVDQAEDLDQFYYSSASLLDCLNTCTGYRILIFDCCRTNPFRDPADLQRLFEKGISRQIALETNLRRGIIVYTAQFDAYAHEQDGKGLFASVLVDEMRHKPRKAIDLLAAVQKRLNSPEGPDLVRREVSATQIMTIAAGERHDEILLIDESDRYSGQPRVDAIELAGNVTSISPASGKRVLAVSTNRVWKSVKANSSAAPERRVADSEPSLRLYGREARDWEKICETPTERKAFAVAISDDGRTCYAGYEDGRITRWRIEKEGEVAGKPFLDRHKRAVNALAVSRDEKLMLSVSRDKRATLHHATTRISIGHQQHAAEVWGGDISFDSQFVATGSKDGQVRVWSVADPSEVLASISFSPSGVRSLRWGNISHKFAVGLTDGSVRLLTLDASSFTLESKSFPLRLRLFDPLDSRIWAQARYRKPEIVPSEGRGPDAKAQNKELIETRAHVLSLAFDPEDKTLVAGTDLMGMIFVDLTSERQFKPRLSDKTFGRTTRVAEVAFSRDGSTLFMGNGRYVHVLTFE